MKVDSLRTRRQSCCTMRYIRKTARYIASPRESEGNRIPIIWSIQKDWVQPCCSRRGERRDQRAVEQDDQESPPTLLWKGL